MPTPVSTAVLKAVPLFANVPEEQLRMLTVVVTRKSVSRSTTIMAGGDATDSLYIVLSGRLKVMMSDSEGKEVILAILGPGEFFGEMGLIDDEPRSASVVSIEPCELLSIAKRDFKRVISENSEMAMSVMRGLVRRLREADRKIGSLALLLLLVFVSYSRDDPGWSHTATGAVAHNAGGVLGAWLADVVLYLFGVSAYWFIALCAVAVLWGFRRLEGRAIAVSLAGFAV